MICDYDLISNSNQSYSGLMIEIMYTTLFFFYKGIHS